MNKNETLNMKIQIMRKNYIYCLLFGQCRNV